MSDKVEELKAMVAQYEIYVRFAEALVERRAQLNRFYVTINTAIWAGFGFSLSPDGGALEGFAATFPLVGIVVCWFWIKILTSHKTLINEKFKVVHAIETKLPVSPYKDEAAAINLQHEETREKNKSDRNGNFGIAKKEKGIPQIFILGYVSLVIFIAIKNSFIEHGVKALGNFVTQALDWIGNLVDILPNLPG